MGKYIDDMPSLEDLEGVEPELYRDPSDDDDDPNDYSDHDDYSH
jgi:hypothetical protein